MDREKSILYLLIAGLLIFIFLFKGCERPVSEYNIIESTEVIRDTIIETRTFEVTKDSFIYETIHVPVPQDGVIVDTMAILQDYFNKLVYNDTITDDSTYTAIIRDTISQNRIQHRDFVLNITQPTIINTTINKTVIDTCPDPRSKLFLGLRVGGNQNQAGVGPSVLFIPKNEHATLGYDYDLVNKTHNISVHKKLSFKK